MNSRSVIDNFSINGSRITLGGWAYFQEKGGIRVAAEKVEVDGIDIESWEFQSRGDFSADVNQFGFRFVLNDVTGLLSILSGVIKCFAVLGEHKAQITVWNKLYARIYAEILCNAIKTSEESEKEYLVAQLTKQLSNREKKLDTETQNISVETGFSPYDKSVVLGRSGYAFLFSGTNNVHNQYIRRLDQKLAIGWSDIIRSRNDFCEEKNINFLQVIIPEKQSILHQYYPHNIETPTKAYSAIADNLKDESFFLDFQKIFEEIFIEKGLVPYRKMDSHLSFHGAMSASLEICNALVGIRPKIKEPVLYESVVHGDLGSKFGFGNIVEKTLLPDIDWDFGKEAPTLINKFDPAQGHYGALRQWENSSYLIDKRLLIFGNSVSERGSSAFGLSWWLARIFKSTTFVWSNQFDKKMVEEFNPDCILSQSVERFLPTLPKS